MDDKDFLDKTYENLKREFEQLKLQASLGKAELRERLQPEMDSLSSQLDDLAAEIQKLADRGEDSFKDVGASLKKAADDLGKSLDAAIKQIKS